jgi:hypothetical protein
MHRKKRRASPVRDGHSSGVETVGTRFLAHQFVKFSFVRYRLHIAHSNSDTKSVYIGNACKTVIRVDNRHFDVYVEDWRVVLVKTASPHQATAFLASDLAVVPDLRDHTFYLGEFDIVTYRNKRRDYLALLVGGHEYAHLAE